MTIAGYTYEADLYCEHCLPGTAMAQDVSAIFQWEESGDVPPHCSVCHDLIDQMWSPTAIHYAVDLLGIATMNVIVSGKTCHDLDVLDEWAQRLNRMVVERADYDIVEDYWEMRENNSVA